MGCGLEIDGGGWLPVTPAFSFPCALEYASKTHFLTVGLALQIR
jgi:hypothetical protein